MAPCSGRRWARVPPRGTGLALSVTLAIAVAPLSCAGQERSNGAACLRGEDCTSGICEGQVCVASSPTFDAAGPAVEAGSDVVPSDAPADTRAPKPDVTPHDTGSADAPDSAPDASTDAPVMEAAPPVEGGAG